MSLMSCALIYYLMINGNPKHLMGSGIYNLYVLILSALNSTQIVVVIAQHFTCNPLRPLIRLDIMSMHMLIIT